MNKNLLSERREEGPKETHGNTEHASVTSWFILEPAARASPAAALRPVAGRAWGSSALPLKLLGSRWVLAPWWQMDILDLGELYFIMTMESDPSVPPESP